MPRLPYGFVYDCEAQLTKECKLLKADYESRPQTTAWNGVLTTSSRHPHASSRLACRVRRKHSELARGAEMRDRRGFSHLEILRLQDRSVLDKWQIHTQFQEISKLMIWNIWMSFTFIFKKNHRWCHSLAWNWGVPGWNNSWWAIRSNSIRSNRLSVRLLVSLCNGQILKPLVLLCHHCFTFESRKFGLDALHSPFFRNALEEILWRCLIAISAFM